MAERLSGGSIGGYYCNLRLVGNLPNTAMTTFDTYRNCAYWGNNTGLMGGADGVGVVADVSDPSNPVQTDSLTAIAMRNPGESLRVNARRGLLVADHYNFIAKHPSADPEHDRALAVYDVSKNCRKPKLLADVIMPTAVGHEGCFQPDGQIYYMSGVQSGTTAIDLSDPRRPRQINDSPWMINSHGCSTSDNGKIGYFTVGGGMLVLDLSEVVARKKNATYKIIGRIDTPDNKTQQGTIPLIYNGKPYVFLWAESVDVLTHPSQTCRLSAASSNWGYGQMIDMSSLKKPVEVSKLMLEVHNPDNCAVQAADRSPQPTGLGPGLHQQDATNLATASLLLYDFHQCRVDRMTEPTILACANFASGLRVFDIRNPKKIREIAYYNTGTQRSGQPNVDYAASHPVIRRDLGQIWWPTMYGGLQIAQFRKGVWPFAEEPACADPNDWYAAQYDLQHAKNCKAARRGADAAEH